MSDYSCSAKCKNGGASYEAGDGIVIEDKVISVDDTEVQSKLTAGNGISISDNVISAIPPDFILYDDFDWATKFIADGKLKYDICVYGDSGTGNCTIFLPKGTSVTSTYGVISESSNGIKFAMFNIGAMFTDSGTGSGDYRTINVTSYTVTGLNISRPYNGAFSIDVDAFTQNFKYHKYKISARNKGSMSMFSSLAFNIFYRE